MESEGGVEYEIEAGIVQKKQNNNWKTTLKTLMWGEKSILAPFFWLVTIFLLCVVISSNLCLWLEHEQNKNYKQPTELEFTTEFQMTVGGAAWRNRNAMLKEFFSYLSEISGYPFLDYEIVENLRRQTYFYPYNCSTGKWDVEFRQRQYFWGPQANKTTLDAKLGTINYEQGLIAPLEPAPDQLKNSFQKLEHDVHPCDTKHSRESRVKDIPYEPNIKTCGDLHRYYPYIWSNSTNDNLVTESSVGLWYTGVYSGIFDNGVKFKADVTLKYKSLDDLFIADRNVSHPPSGEFSLRIWSTHNGHGAWNKTSYNQIAGWHRQLLDHFGSGSDWPCKLF